MPSQPQIEMASMLTKIIISSILSHNDTLYKERLKSLNYLQGEHAQTQIELSKCRFLQFLKDGALEN